MFQSLLGFLMRCDSIRWYGSHVNDNKFQSLLGFLMRCDIMSRDLAYLRKYVSIPAGFSDALRLEKDTGAATHS